ncbi:MAG: sigma-70 family RNA polymerase sigma factor [Actinomycetota bacterium]|nr:sigma-70 family RNA polymerase sigma factor [Actinomycetota bacterium]
MAGRVVDDRELLEAARAGDQSAWDALVAAYGGRVWAVARAHRLSSADAEDVFQVTFLRLVTHLDTIRQPERVGAWLATTARRECLRVISRAGRGVPYGDDEAFDLPDVDAAAVDAGVLAAERDQALLAAVSRLSAKCQTLLRVLMADPEPTYEQVSAALDMPVGSIGPTRGRCLNQLRRELARITEGGAGSQPV